MELTNGKGQIEMRSKDLPASVGMLENVRDELKSDISRLEYKMMSHFKAVDGRFNTSESRFSSIDARFNEVDARFNAIDARFSQVDARFNEVDARFSQVDARFNEVDARFDKMDSKLDLIKSEVQELGVKLHQMHLLATEQRNENRIVLDGLVNLFHRQENMEKRLSKLEV